MFLYSILIMKLRVHEVSTVLRKQLSVVVSGDCSTVRQPRVQEVTSGEDDAYYIR